MEVISTTAIDFTGERKCHYSLLDGELSRGLDVRSVCLMRYPAFRLFSVI